MSTILKYKIWVLTFLGLLVLASAVAIAMSETDSDQKTYSWRYKMTVTVETPEGIKTGSAVREISNSLRPINLPDVGNPAKNSGEAVVVDLGERGALFALVSDQSDNEFYRAIPTLGYGSTTPKAMKYYANLEPGVKGVLKPEYPPGYPKLVTFTDLNDPKSVTLAQVWERNRKDGLFYLKEDRMEKLFGEGVKLKSIVIETTDEPKTKTNILETLPKFDDEFWEWRKKLEYSDPRKISGANFSKGTDK